MICLDLCSRVFFLLRVGGGGVWLVGYCMMIEIVQMALSYYLNKLQKYCFLKQWNDGMECSGSCRYGPYRAKGCN